MMRHENNHRIVMNSLIFIYIHGYDYYGVYDDVTR